MIINALIDLELTQSSGQTSQPPWKKIIDSYSDLVCINISLYVSIKTDIKTSKSIIW